MIHSRRQLLQFAAGAGVLGLAGLPLTVSAASVRPDGKSALLVIDVQNCFLPGGTLPVKEGDQVIAVINRLAGSRSFSDTNRVLAKSRQSIAWEGLGHAIGAYASFCTRLW